MYRFVLLHRLKREIGLLLIDPEAVRTGYAIVPKFPLSPCQGSRPVKIAFYHCLTCLVKIKCKSQTTSYRKRMKDLVIVVLFIFSVLVVLVIVALCTKDWSTVYEYLLPRRRRQHLHPESQMTPPQQHVRDGPLINSNVAKRYGSCQSTSYRPHEGYVLKSTVDPPEESTDAKIGNQELTTRIHSADVPDENGAPIDAALSVKNVQLLVDFGDFEILPMKDVSCPICLVEYEHGELVQRSSCNERYYANYCCSSNTNADANQSVDINLCDHVFHKNCITEWMQSSLKTECPICRRLFCVGDTLANHRAPINMQVSV